MNGELRVFAAVLYDDAFYTGECAPILLGVGPGRATAKDAILDMLAFEELRGPNDYAVVGWACLKDYGSSELAIPMPDETYLGFDVDNADVEERVAEFM